MARAAARRTGRQRSGVRRADAANGAATGSEANSGRGAGALLAGTVAVAGAVSLGVPGFGVSGGGSPGLQAAALIVLILAAFVGAALPHLDRSSSFMGRLLGRHARYFGELMQRFGYPEGPTHSLTLPLVGAAVLAPGGYYFFGSYGVGLALSLWAGYLLHVVADLLVYGRPVAVLWPVRRERISPGRWTGDSGQAEQVASRAANAQTLDLVGGRLPALLRQAATPALLLALAYLTYSTVWASISTTEPGFLGRTLDAALSYASSPSSISLRTVIGLVVFAAVLFALVRLLPALGERAAGKAAVGGEYGGLSTHLIRPTSREAEIEPERFRRLVGRLAVPDSGFYPEVVVGDRVGAAVSGREVGEIKDRLYDEYMMDATVVPLEVEGALAASPAASAEGTPAGDGPAEDGSPKNGQDPRAEGDDDASQAQPEQEKPELEQVACRFELEGELIRGILGSTELGKHDPLTGALNGIRRALDVTRGERALLQMCVRPVNEGSRSPLQSRIDEIKEKEAQQGQTKLRKKSGLIWWLLLLSRHGKMRDYYNRHSLKKEISEQTEKVSPEEREERKQLAERAQQPTFLVELRMLAYIEAERDPDSFLSAAEGYANAFDRLGGAAWTMAEESVGESALARRVSLRLPGPPPGRDETRDMLTADELTAMWHPLGKAVDVQGREVSSLVTRPPHVGIPTDGLLLGRSDDPAYPDFGLYLEEQELDTSGELIGETGNGKSTMILSLLIPAIESGIGAALFDPKNGDLFTEVVSALPKSVLDRVILFDPGDENFRCPVLNPLDPVPYMSVEDQAETIVKALQYRFADGFGHNMRPIFVQTALACIAANAKRKAAGLPSKYGLLDLTETGFLAPRIENDPKENDYEQPPLRAEVLSHLRGDPRFEDIVHYWDNKDATQSAGQQSKEWNPITNKIGQLKNPNVAKIFASGSSDIDLMDVLQNGKVLLFNLSQGSMAGDSHELIGTLILNLIMRTAAIRHDSAVRAGNPKSMRRFINVVDEVQNFLCSEMEKVLTEGRAMRCSLWSAHQFINQIRQVDRKMADAFANAGTTVLFGTTHDDAKHVAEFVDDPRFTHTVMSNMLQYHFVLQRKNGEPVTGETIPMPGIRQKYVQKVRRYSAAQVAGGVHRTSAAAIASSANGSSHGSVAGQERAESVSSSQQAAGGALADQVREVQAPVEDGTQARAAGVEPQRRENAASSRTDSQSSKTGKPESDGRRGSSRYGDRESVRHERTQIRARVQSRSVPLAAADDSRGEDKSEAEKANTGGDTGWHDSGVDEDECQTRTSEETPRSETDRERAGKEDMPD